jgi:hypothetical protein
MADSESMDRGEAHEGPDVRVSRLTPGALALALLGWTVVCFLWESWSLHSQIDDAYISYRYARNLVEGHGLVFNVGEYVEGFSNLLWTLLIAIGIVAGFEANQVGHALGLASGVALLLATYLYARSGLSKPRVWVAALAPLVVLASKPFYAWATAGLETALFAALSVAALAAQARGRIGWATLAVILATATRPDGVIVAGVVLVWHLWSADRARWRSWRAPSAYALAMALLTAFRLVYYGSPLPNTFYAKVGGIPIERGVSYLAEFLGETAFLLFGASVLVFRDRLAWPGALFCAVLGAYAVAIGGDAFVHSRFLLPALCCLAALSVRGVESVRETNPRVAVLLAATIPMEISWLLFGIDSWLLLIGALLAAAAYALTSRRPVLWLTPSTAVLLIGAAGIYLFEGVPFGSEGLRGEMRGADVRSFREEARPTNQLPDHEIRFRAELLRSRRPPVRLVASMAIGRFGYYSRLPILDLYGIVDPSVARSKERTSVPDGRLLPGHQRSNASYVLARKPDYIVIPRRRAGGPTPPLPAIVAIWGHPDLDTYYR